MNRLHDQVVPEAWGFTDCRYGSHRTMSSETQRPAGELRNPYGNLGMRPSPEERVQATSRTGWDLQHTHGTHRCYLDQYALRVWGGAATIAIRIAIDSV